MPVRSAATPEGGEEEEGCMCSRESILAGEKTALFRNVAYVEAQWMGEGLRASPMRRQKNLFAWARGYA